MKYMIPRSIHRSIHRSTLLAFLAFLAMPLAACGASTATSTVSDSTASATVDDQLSDGELAKLDDALLERVHAADEALFPVRVKFAITPSRDELSDLFLVAMDRDAVGRVDRATLKAIAGRGDVSRILYIDDGYAEDDEDFD